MSGAARAACVGLLVALAGCGTPPTYVRSRVADLLDVVPIDVGVGWGVGASVRATPLFHVGLAFTPIVSSRVGYEDRLIHGHWSEYQANFPWSLWANTVSGMPEAPAHVSWSERGGAATVYRWQALRDSPEGTGEHERAIVSEPALRSWGRHPPVVREIRGALFLPERRVLLEFHDLRLEQSDDDVLVDIGAPERATMWETGRESRPTSRAWDLFEADVMFVCVGVRVGVRPAEFVDFLLGFTTLDIMGDDLPQPLVWEPEWADDATIAATPDDHPPGGAASP